MKSITTSSYTFPDLIEGGYLYVDKTKQLLPLITESKGQYFLSRPRRFGKSLLISTLEAIFSGRRELFKGLYIDGRDNGKDRYNWKKYPVIKLDMGSTQADSPEGLKEAIRAMLFRIAQRHGVELSQSQTQLPQLFIDLVISLVQKSETGKVVILVDEYDKPLLNHLGKHEAIPYRDILKAFYSVIKTTEEFQRFAIITGVSKFTRVSIFSDLNNLTELTMDADVATLLGYTREEVRKYFKDRLPKLANAIEMTEEETLDELAYWYDGFRFAADSESVFNPVSVGNCFNKTEFRNYWFATATPTFLMDLLKKEPLDIKNLVVPASAFDAYDVEHLAVLPLLVQTGYLTIKEKIVEKTRIDGRTFTDVKYRLDYPNDEVRLSFNESLLGAFTNSSNGVHNCFIDKVVVALRCGDIEEVFKLIPPFFAQIPSKIALKYEKYYQTIFVAMFTMMGTRVKAEVNTNIGFVDAVVETDKFVYVFEFKLDKPVSQAMKQIHEKKYYERYLNSGKKIMLVGVAFSHKTRNIGRHLVEVVAN